MKKRAVWLLPAAFLSLFSLSNMSCTTSKMQQVWWKHFEREVMDEKYDYNNLMVKKGDLDRIMKSVYTIKWKKPLTNEYQDIGTGIAKKFDVYGKEEICLLTVAHNTANIEARLEKECYIGALGGIVKLEKLVFDPQDDIALLKIPVVVETFPFRIGSSNELNPGVYVDIFGALFDKIILKNGVIGLLGLTSPQYDFIKIKGAKGEKKDYIILTLPINPGNSGAPVVVYRDGKPELVGIVEFYSHPASGFQSIGGAISIELAMDRIEKASKGKIKIMQ